MAAEKNALLPTLSIHPVSYPDTLTLGLVYFETLLFRELTSDAYRQRQTNIKTQSSSKLRERKCSCAVPKAKCPS
jgi:hypothetical protein